MSRLMMANPCARCQGRRLKPEILAVKLEGQDGALYSIDEFCALSVEAALAWLTKLSLPKDRGDALAGRGTEEEAAFDSAADATVWHKKREGPRRAKRT